MARPKKDTFDRETRQRLLVAAAEVFGETGYQRTTLEEVATRAEITRSSLLYHFASKKELYLAVLREAFHRFEEMLAGQMKQKGTFEEIFARVTRAWIDFEKREHLLIAVLVRELLDSEQHGHAVIEEKFVPILDRVEAFVRLMGGRALEKDFPVRQAIMTFVMAYVVRRSMGPLGDTLWGEGDYGLSLALALFSGRRGPYRRSEEYT